MSPNQMYVTTYCPKHSLFRAEVIQLKIYLPINTSLLSLAARMLRAEKVSKYTSKSPRLFRTLIYTSIVERSIDV